MKHVVTVKRVPEGVQLHMCPDVMAVDPVDGRVLICWSPEGAKQVAQLILEKAELPWPPTTSDTAH